MNVFHQNAPRPPVVPGEETEGVDRSGSLAARLAQHNPPLTPRTSSLHQRSFHAHDDCAPLGFEPEGQSGSPRGESSSPPSYLAWARNLQSLLSDPEGVALFRKFLEEEGAGDTLDFWFACAGLRKQAPSPPDRVSQIVRVIYRRFFLKTQLEIDESLRKEVHRRIKDANTPLDIHVFDEACESVEKLITDTTYPNFLRSDIYLQHVQTMQNGLATKGSSSESGEASADGLPSSGALATLHEDKELETPSYPPLTKDMLFITQERRATGFRPKPEAFAGLFGHGAANKGGARGYSSYNPVSRQDSELQSLSSDARTESDNMSLTDSSLDGMSLSHHKMSRKQYQRHCQRVKDSASLNRDPYMHQTLIPRTQRIQTEKVHPMKPEQFAAILIKKLESVKRSQEIHEKLAHKLFESEIGEGGGPSAKSLADAIRERFQIDDDNNDQDILDQHVSRVWSDLTPARTPGVSSPRPKSPDFRRNRSCQPVNKMSVSGGGPPNASHLGHHPIPHPYQSARPYSNRHVRPKDKDVFSTFSSDSGNVHDFPEILDHRLHLPKSKSMPDYTDSSDTYSSLPSHDGRFRGSREWMGSSGRRYSKKPELTDSGVSVVSESASNHGSLPPHKDSRVITWLIDSDRTGGCCSHSERDSASSCSGGSRFDTKHHSRGRRTPPPGSSFSGETALQPCMLDEARRRLEEQTRCKNTRQRCSSGSMLKGETPSVGSTLKKGGKSSSTEGYTTVVFSFCDEQFPYRSKIPGHSVTLRQFKEFLPKKGNYRYFFKTECEELDMQVIQEEITDDNEVLPLWEGKVMALVKPID